MFRELVKVNVLSLLAQIVQFGSFPVLIPLILVEMDTELYLIGMISSIPWLTVLLGSPFASALTDRFDARHTTLIGLIITLLGLAIIPAFSQTIYSLVISSFLVGLGLTFRWISCDAWVVFLSNVSSRGKTIGVHESLMGLGIAIGPLTIIYDHNGFHFYFIISSVLILLSIALTLFTKSQESLGKRPAPIPGDSPALFVKLIPVMYLSVIAAVLSGFIEISNLSFLPAFLTEKSLEESRALIYLSAFGLGGALLQLPLGYLSDRLGIRVSLFLVSLLVILGSLYCMVSVGSVAVDLSTMFLWGGAVGGLNTLALIHVGTKSTTNNLGKGMALIACSYTVGSILGPFLSGLAWEMGSENTIMVVFLTLAALFMLMLVSKRST